MNEKHRGISRGTGSLGQVSLRFEELDWRPTPMGDISLRRRLEPSLGIDIYEVKLGEEFLMSSLFTVAEVALADLGLARLEGQGWDVVVGGLGLGYTARAVLADPRVRTLAVVEALGEVIDWHLRALLPLAEELTGDPRCRLLQGDFFALAAADDGFGEGVPDRLHAILVDIDHTPRHVLHPSHAAFYSPAGLRRVAGRLHPGGVFALWSDDPPDPEFVGVLEQVFATTEAHVVRFANPLTGGESANTVYVCTLSLT
jgi:spermidine synthase